MQENSVEYNVKLIKTLGKIIKAHRIKLNKSIYAISAEISMSKSTWREVELGLGKDINLTTLWKIAEALDVLPSELLIEVSEELGSKFTLTGLSLFE